MVLDEQQQHFIMRVRELLRSSYPSRAPRAFTHTYGCQGNVSDGERINGMLSSMGYEFVSDPENADFILFNTCAVREHAEDRVYGNLGELKKFKAKNDRLIIAVCGCMMQEPKNRQRIKQSFPYVDVVFGTFALPRFPQIIYEALSERKRIFDTEEISGVLNEGIPSVRENKLKAFLPIAYGCNNFCTYCIVPYVRGRERSRSFDAVLADAHALVDSGCKEIMLLGQNVNSFGNDRNSENEFCRLLKAINDIDGDFLIRFMTSHPKDCSHELLDTMAGCNKLERHIHLPFQSGSDRILKLMNRGYDSGHYFELTQYAKSVMPDICITSDVIVGFPGETQDDLSATIDLIDRVEFSSLYTFIYSPREGTPAAKMSGQIPDDIKSARLAELIAAKEKIASKRNATMKGHTFRVLAEEKNKNGLISGRTSGNIMIQFTASDDVIGTFCNVTVTQPFTWILKGELSK